MKFSYLRAKIGQLVDPIFHLISLRNMVKVRKRLRTQFHNSQNINVIFLISYVQSWNKVCYLYKELKENPIFNPIIVCVPFGKVHDKDKNDVYDYFINRGYEAINAVDSNGNWVDLKKYKPSYVFSTRPYNGEFPLCYRSEIISKYALLCVIMYGETISTEMAERVINYNYFKNVFCFFATDKYEKDIYIKKLKFNTYDIQKCEILGNVCLEYILNSKVKKKNISRNVIWTPRWTLEGGSNFFEYKDVIFFLANKYRNINYIIRPHPLMFNNFVNSGVMTQKEVDAFKKKCHDMPNVTLDTEKEYVDTFWQSDLLISDFSSLLIEYLVTGKPIIYCLHSTKFEYTDIGKKLLSSVYLVNNKEELIKEFERWYNNIDSKKEDRNRLVKELEIDGCSKKIANKLIEYIEK